MASSPAGTQGLYATVCYDESAGATDKWFTSENCKRIDLQNDRDTKGMLPKNFVFVVQLPLSMPPGGFSRWQQNLVGVLQIDLVHIPPLMLDPIVELTLDAKLGYKDEGAKEWSHYASAVEKRLMDCSAVTIIMFIFGQVSDDQHNWDDGMEDIDIEIASAMYTGVYGMWNIYICAMLMLYAPSHKQWPAEPICGEHGEEVEFSRLPTDPSPNEISSLTSFANYTAIFHSASYNSINRFINQLVLFVEISLVISQPTKKMQNSEITSFCKHLKSKLWANIQNLKDHIMLSDSFAY
ncbi:hypothetical protein Trydic_g13920 [Trypoxylus dichotomus]